MRAPTTTGSGAGPAPSSGPLPPTAALRTLLAELETSAGALAALAAAFNERATGRALAPRLAAAVHRVLETLGIPACVEQLTPAELRVLLAEIRVLSASHRSLEAALPPEPGWSPSSADLIQAAGEVSAGLPRALAQRLAPRLSGLGERLAWPGARFLDVGAGAAALSIEMARAWPQLEVVGLEPWAPALALARANVRAAGLEPRIVLSASSGQELTDQSAFDLAWIPSLFVSEPALPGVLERVWRALRAGAWLLMPVLRAGDSLAASVVRLRAALWNGSALTTDDAEAMLRGAAWIDVQSFASAPASATALLAARKAPDPGG